MTLPTKDPLAVEQFHIVWCTLADGTNDGSTSDTGELQGTTIDVVTWTVPTGIIKDSSNESSVTIAGVTYDVDTVATIWLSGGTHDVDYDLECKITTNDATPRTLYKTITVRVRDA